VEVEIYSRPVPAGLGRDREHKLLSQATTFGQFFAKPMRDFLAARMPEKFTPEALSSGGPKGGGEIERWEILPLFVEMRAAGIDLDGWLLAKSIEAMFGPMAEAKEVGKPFEEALDQHSEADIASIHHMGALCGMTSDHMGDFINKSSRIAAQYVGTPRVWEAIQAVANRRKLGHTPGRLIVRVISKVMQSSK
jgi:hypothetical protein